jgi:hypothetical protein
MKDNNSTPDPGASLLHALLDVINGAIFDALESAVMAGERYRKPAPHYGLDEEHGSCGTGYQSQAEDVDVIVALVKWRAWLTSPAIAKTIPARIALGQIPAPFRRLGPKDSGTPAAARRQSVLGRAVVAAHTKLAADLAVAAVDPDPIDEIDFDSLDPVPAPVAEGAIPILQNRNPAAQAPIPPMTPCGHLHYAGAGALPDLECAQCMINFPVFVRCWRGVWGVSQGDLADCAGISQTTLSRYERGKLREAGPTGTLATWTSRRRLRIVTSVHAAVFAMSGCDASKYGERWLDCAAAIHVHKWWAELAARVSVAKMTAAGFTDAYARDHGAEITARGGPFADDGRPMVVALGLPSPRGRQAWRKPGIGGPGGGPGDPLVDQWLDDWHDDHGGGGFSGVPISWPEEIPEDRAWELTDEIPF